MTRPAFAYPVFERLFERDYFIDDTVLREILALGPEKAVPELLKITDSTLDAFLKGELDDSEWWDTYHFFHALYLLHDLHAPEALDVYRRVLRLDSDSTDFWFDDLLFEEVPDLLARAGQTRLPELLVMLEDPEMILQHRLVASGAIARLATEHTDLRPAISAFLQGYLRHIITHADQAAQLLPADADTFCSGPEDYLGMLLADVQEAGLRELEPELRELHRLNLVDESMAGGIDDIDFDTPNPLLPSPDIFARYQVLRDNPENYSPFHPDAANIARRRAQQEAEYARIRREAMPQQPRLVLPKIGRNDPCPCGSGKKYKKCCG
ncbi:SEC-C metal-binding domain-containing protein [Hymenobacter sp. IS2118]|uniref:SEC-C metal-binding domain-containing protein n=1 Tax=Hymenobacter sp. IS2118 TaxID=1505605 RepID=UPI000553C13A|nr:SEC-C metal-binding domain-containing protein [Hymenobacter sp. IS2118]